MPAESANFLRDLLGSIEQMRRGQAARVSQVTLQPATPLREGEYLARAKRGDRKKFLDAMASVPAVEPEPRDRLPAELGPDLPHGE